MKTNVTRKTTAVKVFSGFISSVVLEMSSGLQLTPASAKQYNCVLDIQNNVAKGIKTSFKKR